MDAREAEPEVDDVGAAAYVDVHLRASLRTHSQAALVTEPSPGEHVDGRSPRRRLVDSPHRHGPESGLGRPVAELPGVIGAPAPDAAAGRDGARVEAARADRGGVQAGHCHPRFVTVTPTPTCPMYGYGLWHLTVPPAITAQLCSVCCPSLLKLNALTLVNPRTVSGGENESQHSATGGAVTAQLLNGSASRRPHPSGSARGSESAGRRGSRRDRAGRSSPSSSPSRSHATHRRAGRRR